MNNNTIYCIIINLKLFLHKLHWYSCVIRCVNEQKY